MKKTLLSIMFLSMTGQNMMAATPAKTTDKQSAYLMVYHKDQDHSLHMAISKDG